MKPNQKPRNENTKYELWIRISMPYGTATIYKQAQIQNTAIQVLNPSEPAYVQRSIYTGILQNVLFPPNSFKLVSNIQFQTAPICERQRSKKKATRR